MQTKVVKVVTDIYETHTYILWRVFGWRMSVDALALARKTHEQHYALTSRRRQADHGAMPATMRRTCDSGLWL